ncbi:hypothetical protein CesoFtcFv8_003477 [Champsocephalus esox]|uniref:Uncharacterized protein n=1 Tax=Champsocephalus esox TaxID=159716 RepID=A0AAN8CT31_9TELE|nr:hypothetical protein CesoFtcFv8_003477 [Champsocephalus esox]
MAPATPTTPKPNPIRALSILAVAWLARIQTPSQSGLLSRVHQRIRGGGGGGEEGVARCGTPPLPTQPAPIDPRGLAGWDTTGTDMAPPSPGSLGKQ